MKKASSTMELSRLVVISPGDGGGTAEERERLIDDVRAEIEQHAGTVVGEFLPCILARHGTVAVPAAFEGDEAAKHAGGEHLLDGEEVAVPAAIMEREEMQLAYGGQFDQLLRLRCGRGQGLIDHDIFSGEQALLGDLKVRCVGRADYDEADAAIGEQLFYRAQHAHACGWRILGCCGVAAALHDGCELEARCGADEGCVEDASAEAEADQAGLYFCSHTSLRAVPSSRLVESSRVVDFRTTNGHIFTSIQGRSAAFLE